MILFSEKGFLSSKVCLPVDKVLALVFLHCPREAMGRTPISSAPSRRSTPLPLLLPLLLSYLRGSDEKWAGQRIKSNSEV